MDCYRKDHQKVYPNAQVPSLPERGMDPKFFGYQQAELQRKGARDLIAEAQRRPLTEEEQKYLAGLIERAIR